MTSHRHAGGNRIEDDFHLVQIDSDNGAITRIYDKIGGLELISEPALADSFRLCLGRSNFGANYLFGCDQRLAGYSEEGQGCTLE